jgi:hypothetical protein
MRRKHRSDGNQAAIVKALHQVGILTWSVGRPVDLLAWKPGCTVVPLEVKMPGREDELEPTQRDFLATAVGFVVTTPEQAITLVRKHSRRP